MGVAPTPLFREVKGSACPRLLVDGTGIVKLSDFGGALPIPRPDDPQANAVRKVLLYNGPREQSDN